MGVGGLKAEGGEPHWQSRSQTEGPGAGLGSLHPRLLRASRSTGGQPSLPADLLSLKADFLFIASRFHSVPSPDDQCWSQRPAPSPQTGPAVPMSRACWRSPTLSAPHLLPRLSQ